MPRRADRIPERVPEAHARPVAAGGWRRAALGLLVGAVAGVLVCRALPPGNPAGAGQARPVEVRRPGGSGR